MTNITRVSNIIRIIFNILLLISFIVCEEHHETEILNENVKIVGTILKTHKGNDFFAFRGIPYAKPPINEGRFKDPEPYDHWDGILDAKKDGKMCPQNSIGSLDNDEDISEDCLTLNVYTKSLNANQPVIVYIHGGGYKIGSGQSKLYGPQYLLDEDITLVTFNYRLAPFGYVSTGTKDAAGNYGFKDQVLVLKWVQKYIQHFGGDHNKVTLMGHSAGGMAVTLHLVSPMSKNLFHSAIVLSGSATAHIPPSSVHYTKLLAQNVNCFNTNPAKMIECLRSKPWKELIEASINLETYGFPDLKFNYEIEKDFGQERFLEHDPSSLIKNGNFHRVPLIVGLSKDEFGYFAVNMVKRVSAFKTNFIQTAADIFNYKTLNENDIERIGKRLFESYFNNQTISAESEKQMEAAYSDSIINHGVYRLIKLASEYVNVYFFSLDYVRSATISSTRISGESYDATHEDNLLYLFKYSEFPEFNENQKEMLLVNRFVKSFTHFAANGVPSIDDDEYCATKWPTSTPTKLMTLHLSDGCVLSESPYPERINVWDELFPIE